ncbi:hypothetical protein ZWY2020_041387 [Hordeum vulgare]|nr:hypothetical protein ZWY2020_041387 [Hordeum vulgare]
MDRVRWQVDRANRRGPSIGLVTTHGRRSHIGSIRGVNVKYAGYYKSTTTPLFFQLNASVTVQTLLDVFSVSGIVHYGTAGSCNDSVSFGDVSVPKLVAYTGAWTWKVFSFSN